MSGRNKECAVLLQEKGPPQFTTTVSIMISVQYLVNVRKYEKLTLDSLKQLGIFFKYSPNDITGLKIILSNIMQPPGKIKNLPKRISRCFVKHYSCWEKHCTLTFRTCMSHTYNVLKALNQQMVATAVVLFRCRDF